MPTTGVIPTAAATGRNQIPDSHRAGSEAAREALDGLSDSSADAALVFATSAHDQGEILRGVREVLGDVELAGCSGEGVISSGRSDECEFAVAVLALSSESMRFEALMAPDYAYDPAGAGVQLAEAVRAGGTDDLVGLMVFPDGLEGNCTQFLEELQAGLGDSPVALAGGTAADAMTFERTYQYARGEVRSGAVAALVVRGRGRMELAVAHGCTPIGLQRTVTRSEGGWVQEIDGRSAWSVFKEYLDGDPVDLNAEGIVHLCLGQHLEGETGAGYSSYIIRSPMRLGPETGSLYFPGGGLATGQRIQLTRRDPHLIRKSAEDCAESILSRSNGRAPAAVMQFDCAGRGRILFGPNAAAEIVLPLQERIGTTTPWIGFHTYGEIAPIGGRFYYHNYTVVLCALYDGLAEEAHG